MGVVMAMIFPILFMLFLGTMSVLSQIPAKSGEIPALHASPQLGTTNTQVYPFLALSRAVLSYAEANPAVNGAYDSAQLSPYMGGIAFPASWGAENDNGTLVVWDSQLSGSDLGMVKQITSGDCAYGQVSNGQILSQCNGVGLGTAPSGVSGIVWTIIYPANESN